MAGVTFEETGAGGQARTPLHAAWACAQLGLRVLPLVPGTKRAALKGWPELATLDDSVIEDWWHGDHYGCGVGIATGAESGIWVLDIDRKRTVDGYATLAGLVAEAGVDATELMETMSVATPSGGAHLYFRWVDGVRNSTGGPGRGLGPGLDVRGHGGLVAAPGWGGYQVVPRDGVRSTRILEAPAWLAERVQQREAPAAGRGIQAQADDEYWAARRTKRALRDLGQAPSGTRNDELNRAAYRLGMAGQMSHGEAWEACQAIMARIGARDAVEAQRKTFESGWEAGRRAGNMC
jgi:hypothetical protein